MTRPIDIHAHYYPQAYLEILAREGQSAGLSASIDETGFTLELPTRRMGPLPRRFVDLEPRVADMDRQGMAVQALSLTMPMVYVGDERLSIRLAEAFNDALVEASQRFPGRLVGLVTLPMQYPERALEELERMAGRDGIAGIYLGTNIGGEDLGQEKFLPVFERIAALGLSVFLHPLALIGRDGLDDYYLANLLGNPFDTAIAAAYLMFGGVLDRLPTLRVCLPHAGGALPYLIGRFDHGHKVRRECAHLPEPPSHYLRRFWYDTISHSEPALRYLVGLVGSDRVVLGSDYCFDMGDDDPVGLVNRLDWLDRRDKDRIVETNARTLLNLD